MDMQSFRGLRETWNRLPLPLFPPRPGMAFLLRIVQSFEQIRRGLFQLLRHVR